MPNPLSRPLLDALQLVRVLRSEYRACQELLSLAIEMLQERDRELDSARRQHQQLRAEFRALVSGRTIAAERQALEQEQLSEGEGIAA